MLYMWNFQGVSGRMFKFTPYLLVISGHQDNKIGWKLECLCGVRTDHETRMRPSALQHMFSSQNFTRERFYFQSFIFALTAFFSNTVVQWGNLSVGLKVEKSSMGFVSSGLIWYLVIKVRLSFSQMGVLPRYTIKVHAYPISPTVLSRVRRRRIVARWICLKIDTETLIQASQKSKVMKAHICMKKTDGTC